MALAQLMPGPLAAQLAIYLGYVHYRIRGATLVGLAFVLPSFAMVVAIGAVYTRYGGIGWMQAVFYGVGAAVIGIIAMSAYKLTTKNIGKDRLLWAIFLVSAAVTVITKSEIVWIFLGAGVLVWLVRAPPKASRGAMHSSPPDPRWFALDAIDWHRLGQIGAYFAYAGSFVFGSGPRDRALPLRRRGQGVRLAHGQAVRRCGGRGHDHAGPRGHHHRLHRVPGGWFLGRCGGRRRTFLPCYLFTILPAPYFKKHGKRPAIVAFVDGVTAAAIGAITGAVIVIGQRSITDLATAALALITVGVLWRFKKVPEPVVVVGRGRDRPRRPPADDLTPETTKGFPWTHARPLGFAQAQLSGCPSALIAATTPTTTPAR
jgi:chromate transporter